MRVLVLVPLIVSVVPGMATQGVAGYRMCRVLLESGIEGNVVARVAKRRKCSRIMMSRRLEFVWGVRGQAR